MKSDLERQQTRVGWLFVSPALVLIGAFFFVPVVVGLLLSLTDFDIYAIGAPGLKDPGRVRAIASVKGLFQGFIERFGTTDCCTLTGCDFSQKTDVRRYYKEKIYQNTCYRQFDYVLRQCLAQLEAKEEIT